MEPELRRGFHDDLARVQQRVVTLGLGVVDAIRRATAAVTTGDRAAVEGLVDVRRAATSESAGLDEVLTDLLARQAPVGRDLRFLFGTARVVQELDLSGGLVASIAERVGRITEPTIATTGPLINGLAASGADLLDRAVRAYAVADPHLAARLAAEGGLPDRINQELLGAALALGDVPASDALELGLLARFLGRIADHALVVGAKTAWIANPR